MDAMMPVMDGPEATRRVRAQWPEVRVIILTIHTALRAEALAAGADAFLVKGCPAGELLAAILEQWAEFFQLVASTIIMMWGFARRLVGVGQLA
jgi:CheY-like chemotaxis protein